MAEDQSFEPYRDKAGQVIKLSAEGTEPLSFFGEIVKGSGTNRDKKYAKSIKRFPSVLDCLMETERNKLQPDLTQLDWQKIDSEADAEVCMYRVGSSYEDAGAMKEWLKKQGFKVTSFNAQDGKVYLSGVWSIPKYGPKFYHNIFDWLWLRLISHGTSFGVTYDINKKVIESNITQTIL